MLLYATTVNQFKGKNKWEYDLVECFVVCDMLEIDLPWPKLGVLNLLPLCFESEN